MQNVLVGPLADKGYIRGMFWICLPFAAQILLPAAGADEEVFFYK